MAKKSTFGSYIKYGIGEIILVVVGILIAIQINNWNEKRKDSATVHKIFTEMQNDLLNDIEESSRLIRSAEINDKRAEKVLASEIKAADYSDPEKSYLFTLGSSTYPLHVTNLAFNKLAKFEGHIPEEYEQHIKKLNQLYIEEKMYIDELYKRLSNYTQAYQNEMYAKYEWMPQYEKAEITPPMLDYFLNDPLYKNHIQRYRNLLFTLGQANARRFKRKASMLYFDIEKNTKSGKIPEIISAYAPKNDTTFFKQYTGVYKDTTSQLVSTLHQKNGRLFSNTELVLQESKDSFKYENFMDTYVYFRRNDEGEIIGSIIKWSDQRIESTKID